MVREGTSGYVPLPYPSTRYVYPTPGYGYPCNTDKSLAGYNHFIIYFVFFCPKCIIKIINKLLVILHALPSVLHGYAYRGVGYTYRYRVLGYGNGTYPDIPSCTASINYVPGTP